MKITFLEACNFNFYTSKSGGPLGLAYMASYIEKNIDEKFEFSIEVDVERAIKNKPDIIGISAYTQNYPKAVSAAEKIKKELDIPVIVGGKHITALPSNIKSCFDVGVVGDGELTMSDLVKMYIDKKALHPEDLYNIPGIVFRDGDKLHITPEREPLRNLDILPPPKRDILFTYWPGRTKKWIWGQGLYTSRGCPYKCPFCVHSKIRFVTRYHSPARVVSEIEEVIRRFPDYTATVIYDDLFAVNKKRLREIVNLIVAEKINRKLSFSVLCKSSIFDEEVAIMLKEMNVRYIAFGFESGDEKTLQYLKKDSSSVEDNIRAIDLCDKFGMYSTGYFVTGSPPETKEALNKTYWFIRKHYPPMRIAGTFFLKPYPGTKTWDYALEKGLVNEETEDWENYDYHYSEDQHKIFLNEHYDYDFFKEASYYFHEIHIRDRLNLVYINPVHEIKYYESVFKEIKKYDIKFDDILEVGTYYLPGIKSFFEDEKEVTKFDHWIYLSGLDKIKEYELSVLAGKQFDTVIFNHSLEQMINPYEKLEYLLKNYLKPGGKVIVLIKNQQSMKNMVNLIKGKWESLITGIKRLDDYYHVNITELKTKLKAIGIKKLSQDAIKEDVSSYSEVYNTVIPVISQSFFINNFQHNAETVSFLLTGDFLDL